MGKNRKFKNVYKVTVEGTTTNGFSANVFDTIISALPHGHTLSQVTVSVDVESTEGDFNAITKEVGNDISR